MIELSEPFFSLPDFDVWNIDISKLELMVGQVDSGLDLGNIKKETPLDRHKRLVPFFETGQCYLGNNNLNAIARSVPEDFSISAVEVMDDGELKKIVSLAYQISYSHYVLAKTHNIKGKFPVDCCGISSRNVMFSLVKFGIFNAVYGYDLNSGHGVDLIPIRYYDENKVILIDPTSDQNNCGQDKRNFTGIFDINSIDYEFRGHSWFPSRIIDIVKIKEKIKDYYGTKYPIDDARYYVKDVEDYFNNCFHKTFRPEILR